MIKFFKNIFNDKLIRDIIDNFDPYHINELMLIELNKLKVGNLNHMWNIGEKHPHYGKRGELAPNFGKSQSEYQKQRSSEKIMCIHCKKMANIGNIRRWHNNNCKLQKGENHEFMGKN